MATEKTVNNTEVLDITAKSIKTTDFVFMEKTLTVLNLGLESGKNVILYGPGGYGKSQITEAFFNEKGITPYTITMGTGMTTDRLFGGLDIPTFNSTGKIEYLVENSFMNHEYVVFEELFDAPDFILEQLKDILSSGVFRNGSQVFNIKTKYIICATNRTREEFSKNASLQALMERFPLELNVVWDNHNEIAYNTLLESKFGVGNVDPLIPFVLEQYAKKGIIISPRVAKTAYDIFLTSGIDGLMFIADFNKKSDILKNSIKEFEDNAKINEIMFKITEISEKLFDNDLDDIDKVREASANIKILKALHADLVEVKVSDNFVSKLNDKKTQLDELINAQNKRIMIATSINEE